MWFNYHTHFRVPIVCYGRPWSTALQDILTHAGCFITPNYVVIYGCSFMYGVGEVPPISLLGLFMIVQSLLVQVNIWQSSPQLNNGMTSPTWTWYVTGGFYFVGSDKWKDITEEIDLVNTLLEIKMPRNTWIRWLLHFPCLIRTSSWLSYFTCYVRLENLRAFVY